MNLRAHGHGQGYTDLNFLIPELIARVEYWKGPYYANIGDFGSAGGAFMHYYDNMKEGIVFGTGGDYGYARALLAGSAAAGPGVFTYGLEYLHNDGPWEVPDNFRKYNAVARYVMPLAGGQFQTTAYWFKYNLNLFSNFTYFLDDPDNGDQFEQADDRNVYGWTGSWSKLGELFGAPTRNTVGFELRQDRIDPVGLYSTRRRERLSTTREDDVTEGGAGICAQNDTQWNDWLRSVVGLRYDRYRFKVDASIPENSGAVTSGIASPKGALVFGPWANTEYFVNAGYGFHSNDARGVTIKVDPKTGAPVDAATPLVRSKGAELGVRTEAIEDA